MDVVGFAIQPKSRTDLRNYSQFSYMTATTTGLPPEAASIADERIKGMVDAVVGAAVADDDGECLEGEPKCGYFEQLLKPLPCRDGFLCLEQHVYAAPVGLAISDEQVAVLVLDPHTGRAANLSDVVRESDREAFLDAVNESVAQVQKSEGAYDASDAPRFSEADFAAWAPRSDGIHVWFPKYAAGPGSMGVVEVVVAESDVLAARERSASGSSDATAGSWSEAIEFFCARGPAEMPELVDSSADAFATSVLQLMLSNRAYDVGPIDGVYGPTTRKAVRAYQQNMRIAVDGLVGPQTWQSFGVDCEYEGNNAGASPDPGTTSGSGNANRATMFALNILMPNVECGFQSAVPGMDDLTSSGEVRFYDGRMNLLYVARLGTCFIPGFQGAPEMSERAKGAWQLTASVPPTPDGVYQVVVGTKGRNPVSFNASDAINDVIYSNIIVR